MIKIKTNENPDGVIFGSPAYFAEAEKIAREARLAFAPAFDVMSECEEQVRGGKGEMTKSSYKTSYDMGQMTYDGKHNITYVYFWGIRGINAENDTRLIESVCVKDGKQTEFVYAYSNDGVLLSKVNATEKIINTYEYDDNGLMLKAIAKFGNGKKTMFTNYEYDNLGRVTSVKSKFVTTTYSYNDTGLAITKTVEKMIRGEEQPRITTTTSLYNTNGEVVKDINGKRETIYKYENGYCASSKTYYNRNNVASTSTTVEIYNPAAKG